MKEVGLICSFRKETATKYRFHHAKYRSETNIHLGIDIIDV